MPSNIEGSRLRYGYDKAKGTDRSCLTVWKNQECLFLLWDNQADAFVELIQSAEERGMRRVIAAVRGKEPVTAAGTTEQAQNKADAVLPFMHGQWETDLKAAESLIPKE